ncbi:flagellar assembly protein FliW [Paenibacillus sp. 7541]|uniref:flagellar assembly protein FliW n=1 Tax=Paenibacillus sp. 7541 TaxID=2026236 RepID=UPI000BA60413|nr:flagellar assembly protein FliW [Paenibacillus sp. 7541]PAK51975.1 flagellar assembly protein FliW [Paenibacillus sp. 7541]
MMVNTRRFGLIEINEDQVITFIGPVLGFETLKKYAFVSTGEDRQPFEFLQAIEDENLTFIVTDPFVFFKDYEFQLDKHWTEALDVHREEDIQVMVIVTVRSPEDITCNLRAPIVINRTKRVAAQVILEQGSYPTKQPLLGGKKGADADVNPVSK